MIGLVRRRAAAVAGGLLLATAANAAAPSPSHSTVPAFIMVGGAQTTAGVPDPSIAFTVTVRDLMNNPIAASTIEVNFSDCTDTKLCTAIVAGRAVGCPNRVVRAATGPLGQATLSIMGASTNTGSTPPPAIGPGAGAGCIRIYADGVELGVATAVVYDQNGATSPFANGVTGIDFAIATYDVCAYGFGAPYRGRTDYDLDGKLTSRDLWVFRSILGRSASGTGSGAGCASLGTAQPYCP